MRAKRAVFISYRREDCEGQAQSLYGDLVRSFGRDAVFMDVKGIPAGVEFPGFLQKQLESCSVLLALMGPGWIDAKDGRGRRRLDDPNDFVRKETASTLKRPGIPVIPVLVHGAGMPTRDQLPEELKNLAIRQNLELRHSHWDSDMEVVIREVSKYVPQKPARRKLMPRLILGAIILAILAGIISAIKPSPVNTPPIRTLHPHH